MLFQPAISIVGKQNRQIFNGFNRFQMPVQGDKTVKTVQLSSFSQIPRLKSRVEKFRLYVCRIEVHGVGTLH